VVPAATTKTFESVVESSWVVAPVHANVPFSAFPLTKAFVVADVALLQTSTADPHTSLAAVAPQHVCEER